MHAPVEIGFFEGIVRDLTSGKGQLRFIIQPIVAILAGVRLGVVDAREGQRPFLLRLFEAKQGRGRLFERSLSDVVLPMTCGVVLDGILQYYTLGFVRPLHALIVGLLLVWLPYALARAITNRIARRRRVASKAAA